MAGRATPKLALVLVALAVGTPAAGATGVPRYPAVEHLERLGSVARYAFLNRSVSAFASPDPSSARVARLDLRTEDGTDELVSVLARAVGRDGDEWVRVRLPVRPNGTTGWVPRRALGELRIVHTWLRIDRDRLRITLVRRGARVFTARIGVGRPSWPTPAGTFYIRDRLQGRSMGSIYGPLAFGTSAHSDVLTDWPGGGVIGIHGTDQPQILPGRVSHGCIRLRNPDILRLGRMLPVGTPVSIR